jgi:sulfoacetaldehyde dehydrogenase
MSWEEDHNFNISNQNYRKNLMAALTEEQKQADQKLITEMVVKARAAQEEFEKYNQEQVDEVVTAIGWAIYQKENAEYLATLEVEETGMGNIKDKTLKNINRTKGAVIDLIGKKSVGIIDVDEETGVTRIAKPKGVIGALTPCTNATPGTIGNALMILKGRNSVIFTPNPRSKKTSDEVIRFMNIELKKIGAPENLIQGISNPTTNLSQELMRQVDLVVATGGQGMVRAAYSSGTPCVGVGAGNSVMVVDETADIEDAAEKIYLGKVFDNATSCSSENSIIVQEGIYDTIIENLKKRGGYVVSQDEKKRLEKVMWKDGHLTIDIICKDPNPIACLAEMKSDEARNATFFIVPETGTGPDHPFSGEKLSVVLAAYKYKNFDDAIKLVQDITDYQGKGHSCGIHSKNEEHIMKLAHSIHVCRILVNQAQAYGNSGNFDNGLPFTATLGCGSWGGNSIDENVTYKHCMNITRLARLIEPREIPDDQAIFGAYWGKCGK